MIFLMIFIKEVILIKVKAECPVSFKGIMHDIHIQVGSMEDYEIAPIVNDMIIQGAIKLYEDGISFEPVC